MSIFTCPLPLTATETVLLGHGSGGKLSADFGVPIVVGGFEPVDLLEAIRMLVNQLESGEARVENEYVRSVSAEGNAAAQKIMQEVFIVADQKWRGIGEIPMSGLKLSEAYAAFDADRVFGTGLISREEPKECISALVLQGLKKPVECSAFAVRCTPEHPLGAPMVSAEGACAAFYQYRRHSIVAHTGEPA